jgi:hypothetical protein
VTLPETVEVPSMLKANELLSGVKETANVVAKIPLFSIHVASDFDPISRTASTECEKRRVATERIMDIDERENRMTVCCCGRTQRTSVNGGRNTDPREAKGGSEGDAKREDVLWDRREGGVRRRSEGGRERRTSRSGWMTGIDNARYRAERERGWREEREIGGRA